ncbi:hypothetical protein [Peloplasma aerotolerans]|uniref:Toxin n=1 Tax=Peloplasma aerotolerans TaxID=3044389 RepID=A0AAW6UAI3_9MOLU|nr:hypothetical protein [Mariniplasma sp. M4Ah]MDI6453689.1 hypothetical protein [Mariniplasma sp. M4Ah]
MNVYEFLKKMRRLINQGSKRFVMKRDGRYYYEILLEDFGITDKKAWEHIKNLNEHFLWNDEMPSYSNSDAFVFKKQIDGKMAYIKVKIEEGKNGEEVVCISFHLDYWANN